MDLYLLAELKTISLKVTTVDMLKPPPDFRTNFEATPPPILIDNGLAVLENEKIERHIMKNVPGGHNLFVQDKDVASRIENVYSVSIHFIIWFMISRVHNAFLFFAFVEI
jgi:chloride intracellular channel protein 2